MNFWGLVVNCFEAAHRLYFTVLMYFFEYSVTISLLLVGYASCSFSFKYLLLAFITGYIVSLGYGLVAILNQFQVKLKVYLFDFVGKKRFKKIMTLTFHMSLASVSYVLLTRIDSIMLSQMTTLSDVGFYNIAAEIARNAAVIGTAVILGSVPLFISSGQAQLFKKTIKKLIFINIIILVGFLLFSKIFVSVVYGVGYESVSKLMMISGLYPLFISLQSFTSEILILKEKSAFLFKSGLFAVIFNIFLNFFFIRWFGVYGAAIATTAAYAFWFLLNFFSVRKLI
jgi:O-antigen/teichoic acid export membrane protein